MIQKVKEINCFYFFNAEVLFLGILFILNNSNTIKFLFIVTLSSNAFFKYNINMLCLQVGIFH